MRRREFFASALALPAVFGGAVRSQAINDADKLVNLYLNYEDIPRKKYISTVCLGEHWGRGFRLGLTDKFNPTVMDKSPHLDYPLGVNINNLEIVARRTADKLGFDNLFLPSDGVEKLGQMVLRESMDVGLGFPYDKTFFCEIHRFANTSCYFSIKDFNGPLMVAQFPITYHICTEQQAVGISRYLLKRYKDVV